VVPTTDLYDAGISGTLLDFTSTSASNMDSQADVSFGALKGLTLAHSDSTGAYVDAGGWATPGIASAFLQLESLDKLTLVGAAPGNPVTISFTQSITSSDSASLGGGGLSIDPCLANGDATTSIGANMVVSVLGGDFGSVGYNRFTSECGPAQIIGSPTDTVTVTGSDGDAVTMGQVVTLTSYARLDGGPGTNPNRARAADALLDASSTALLYVEVLTPGASYTSASGTIYATPEVGDTAGGMAAFATLLAASRLRRRS